ncbi:MAG: hypothetical protein A2Z01_11930 [Betaproteobacteria bacterium RBG_16_58_11]|nr:MAG: hypothetical protein A2Z01_11930 [Betaproteobacteria bacterium RBG_16_58_11]OFZ96422.1 MAG: hypothetical protein A2Z44_01255 [Betaproteobacteria bacterium RBG_19FT_COMBO_58_11]
MKLKTSILVTLTILLAACGKLTVENYDKLKVGMPYTEVKQLLGPPERCSDLLGMKSCTWGDDKRHITVNFIGDQVVIFNAENIR